MLNSIQLAAAEDQVQALRADLTAADFTVSGLYAFWGAFADAALHREQPWAARAAVQARQGEPLATLAGLFILGIPATREAASAALPRLGLTGAELLGLIAVTGDEVRGVIDLRPYEFRDDAGDHQWWIASDLGELATGAVLRSDHVLGVGGATMSLAALTPRHRVARVLDLGTGCGIQAMHAALHATTVVGTDILPRALDFAAFNQRLNEIEVTSWRAGSLLEPVAGEQFDLVVSNPPFVISPQLADSDRHVYRDGGARGDDLTASLVRSLPAVLAPGGMAVMLGNWEYRRSTNWKERVSAWLSDAGVDGWIVQREVQDPVEYIETWLRDGGQGHDEHTQAQFDYWMRDFEDREVEAIGFGFIVLHRPEAERAPWQRVESLGSGQLFAAGMGDYLARCVQAENWLAEHDDAELLAQHWMVAPDVTEERHFMPGDEDPQVIALRQGGGLQRMIPLSTEMAAIVGACDAELSAGAIVGAVAQLLGVERSALCEAVLPVLRDLIRWDMLRLPTIS